MILRFSVLLFLTFAANTVKATTEWIFNPRFENISGEETVFNRAQLQSSLSVQTSTLKLYTDIFAELDRTPNEQKLWRRGHDQLNLQEFYLEFVGDSIFLKLGKQATRWSESWILPSLDVWTARKYERLFVDPVPQQLSHSSGAVFTYVKPLWSIDIAAMGDVPQDTYPEPFPEKIEIEKTDAINPGARLKFETFGLQSTLIAARALQINTFGYAMNYAFDNWVMKAEVGQSTDDRTDSVIIQDIQFATLGTDIFWGNLTMTPQVTAFKRHESTLEPDDQAIAFISFQYTEDEHELQLQGFTNTTYSSDFWSAQYTYTHQQNLSLTALAQNYDGDVGTFTGLVKDQTGGFLFGLRIQYITDLLKGD